MKITVKVQDIIISINDENDNTTVKYNATEIIKVLQEITDDATKLLKERNQ